MATYRGLRPRIQPHVRVALYPAAGVVGVAGLGVLHLQGEAREVSLRIAFVDYRDVLLYGAPALGELDPVEEHLDVAGVDPDIRGRKIEVRLL
jgi:ribosomal protein S18 acetylase RimI-like enzyme